MSKKGIINEIKNGWGWIHKEEIWYGKYLKRYLQKRTCRMTSQEKVKIKHEAEESLKGRYNENFKTTG